MFIKTDKGGRKLAADQFNAVIMLLGLIATLIACCVEKSLMQIAVGLDGVFIAGVLGKATAFNWANTKEYSADKKEGV
jgi:hypothetical protein